MSGGWYWLLFALAVVLLLAVPIGNWFEGRAERRDREAWDEVAP